MIRYRARAAYANNGYVRAAFEAIIAVNRARERAGLDASVNRHALKLTALTSAIMTGLSIEAAAEFFDTGPKMIRAHYWHHSPRHQAEAITALEGKR